MKEETLKSAKIMIVDDQEVNISLLQQMLEQGGYTNLKSTTDSRQAAALFTEFQPDLILLDLMMPHLDGFGVMRELRPLVPADAYLPILVLTADVSPETKLKALSGGAKDFLTKPLDAMEVLLRIRNLLEARLLHRELQRQNEILEERVRERTEVLRESESRYRAIFDWAPVGIGRTDMDGRTIETNRALQEMLGYSEEELRGVAFAEFTHPDDVRMDLEQFGELIAGKRDHYKMEKRYYRKNGRIIWVSLTASIIRDAQGKPQFAFGMLEDITERKTAEEALEKERGLLRTLVDSLPDHISVKDAEGRYTLINTSYGRFLGAGSPDEIVGKSIFDVFPKELAEEYRADDQAVIQSGLSLINKESLTVDRSGNERWNLVTKVPLRDVQGRAVGLVGIARDITDRKQAEEALEKERNLLRTLIDNLPDFIYFKDTDGRFVVANDATARSMGVATPYDLIGETDFDFHPRELAERYYADELSVIRSGQPLISREEPIIDRAGNNRWLSITKVPLKDSQGRIVGLVGIGHDITDRKEAEERIRREAAHAQALVRVASHINSPLDFRTVLNVLCEETAHALNARSVGVTLYDEVSEAFYYAADFGLPPEYMKRSRPTPLSVYEDLVRRMGTLRVYPDVQAFPVLPNRDLHVEMNVRTLVSVSMMHEGKPIGNLNVIIFGEVRVFTEGELALLQGLADQAVLAITKARLLDETQRRLKHLQAQHTIDMAISGSLDLRVTLNILLEQATGQLGVDAADILLLNHHVQTLEYTAGRGFRTKAIERSRLRLGEGHAGRAALERRIVSIPNLSETGADFMRALLLTGEGFVAYYAAPVIAKGHVRGILEAFHRTPLNPDQEWMDFLQALAGQAAIAIDSSEMFNSLQRSNVELMLAYDTTLEGWSKALDLRDKETEGHTQRVTEMTVRLAQVMGFKDNELVHIRRGALLHDIGKMGIPDSILLKAGPLTDEEREIMCHHPAYAYEMLYPISYLRPALDIPYCHHEKWDGTGYPRGLKGDQIPLAARIFAAVDVWDALRSDRPYRAGWPVERVREHIQSLSGTHFDPEVVDVFLEMEL